MWQGQVHSWTLSAPQPGGLSHLCGLAPSSVNRMTVLELQERVCQWPKCSHIYIHLLLSSDLYIFSLTVFPLILKLGAWRPGELSDRLRGRGGLHLAAAVPALCPVVWKLSAAAQPAPVPIAGEAGQQLPRGSGPLPAQPPSYSVFLPSRRKGSSRDSCQGLRESITLFCLLR